jgi:O-antigen ligase
MIFNSEKEKLIFYNFPVLLFTLIPFLLITGPFLSDFSISLISLLFLIYCFKKKNFSYFQNNYFYFFVFFWIYLIFNSLVNNFNLDSLKISFFYFRYGIFVIAIIALLKTNDKFIKYFFYCILGCFIILILDGFYQYFSGVNILGFKTENPLRVSSFFHDEQILGSYISRIWPIFFGLFLILFKKKNISFIILFIVLFLSLALVFFSGDRTAFFYINFSGFFIIIFSHKLSKFKLAIMMSSLLVIIIISYFKPTAFKRVVDQSIKEMNLTNKNIKDEKKYVFTKAHTEIYISAYKMFLDNKIIGVGIKNFRKKCNDQRYYVNNKKICYTHPHNTYIQILTETGLLGFVFLLTILIYFCKYILKHLVMKFKGKYFFSDFEICILSCIAIYLWPFAPTGNIFSNWLNIAMILNIPFLVWSMGFKNSTNE